MRIVQDGIDLETLTNGLARLFEAKRAELPDASRLTLEFTLQGEEPLFIGPTECDLLAERYPGWTFLRFRKTRTGDNDKRQDLSLIVVASKLEVPAQPANS